MIFMNVNIIGSVIKFTSKLAHSRPILNTFLTAEDTYIKLFGGKKYQRTGMSIVLTTYETVTNWLARIASALKRGKIPYKPE